MKMERVHKAEIPAVAAVLALAVGAVGCSSSSSSKSASPSKGATTTQVAGGSGTSPGKETTTAPESTTKPAGATGEFCTLLDESTAATITGATPTKKAGTTATATPMATKVDYCTYSWGDQSIVYQVTSFQGIPADSELKALKAGIPRNPLMKEFPVGLGDDSVGYTMDVNGRTVATVAVVTGNSSLNIVVNSPDAQTIAMKVAGELVPKLG